MSNQILLSESKQKLRDRETMRSVWLNQAEKAQGGRKRFWFWFVHRQ